MANRRQTKKDPPVEYRINTLKTISFIGTGVGLDLLNFGLGITGVGEVADEVIDVAADVAIPGMAWAYGIPLGGKKANERLFTMMACEIAKLVPFVNILPEYTYETWKLIDYTRQEDRERAAEAAKQQGKQDAVQITRQARAMTIQQRENARRQEQARAANDQELLEERAAA